MVRAEVNLLRAPIGDDARAAWRLIEQHHRTSVWQPRRERARRENCADIRVGTLEGNFRRCGEWVDEHRAAPIACGECGDECGRRGQQQGRASATQRANEWCASLEQREAGRDELLRFEVVAGRGANCGNMSAARGKCQRQEREWIAQISNRRSEALRRSAT